MKLKTVEKEITPILERCEVARFDDMKLYTMYVYNKLPWDRAKIGCIERVFNDRRYRIMHEIAPYETVSRVRRRLQAKDATLRPSQEVIDARREEEKKFRNYARGVDLD